MVIYFILRIKRKRLKLRTPFIPELSFILRQQCRALSRVHQANKPHDGAEVGKYQVCHEYHCDDHVDNGSYPRCKF